MMLARIPRLIITKALPRETFRPTHTRLVRINAVPTVQLISRRYATTKSDRPKENTEQTTEGQGQTNNTNHQQGEQEKPKGSIGGTIVVYSIIALGGALLYYTGVAQPLIDYLKANVWGNVSNFFVNLRNNVYHLAGVSTEEVPFLPPPLPEGYGGHKYTLVIDMDALASCEQSNGVWKIYKRAGLEYFLNLMAQHYEIVLYTKEYQGVNQAAIFKLDPAGQFFQHTKFRDSGVKLPNNQFTDRLDLFRRDPAKMIFIDSLKPNETYQHSNVLCIGSPDTKQSDTILIDLSKILHGFAVYGGTDARLLVKDLQGSDINKKINEIIARSKNTRATQQQQPSKGLGSLFGR